MTPAFWRIADSTRPSNRDLALQAEAITSFLV
jgi:hypothetical protein